MSAIGTYVLCDKIRDFPEQGCNSTCYLANDTALGIEIAVKDIPETKLNTANLDSYFSEARIAALASHPRILQIMYAGFDPEKDIARIATKYLPLGSLQKRINDYAIIDKKLMAPKEVCEICLHVAQGMHHLHSLNITHLDIKPSNILFDINMEPVISDFGQSKILKMSVDTAPPMYAKNYSPEVTQHGIISKLSDIYQFGLLIYRMCNPGGFERQFAALAKQGIKALFDAIEAGDFPDRRSFPIHVPKKMIDICKKCLAIAPQDRYSDFYEIQNEISNVEALPLPWYPLESTFRGSYNGKGIEIILTKSGDRFTVNTKINNRRKVPLCGENLTEYHCRAKIKAIVSEV